MENEEYTTVANDVTWLKVVSRPEDLRIEQEEGKREKTFRPSFLHQVFKEDETIYGYKGLQL